MRPKNKPLERPSETDISQTLRWVGTCIGRKKIPQALEIINETLEELPNTSSARARLISLTADADYKRGRFSNAASIYLQAATLGIEHPQHWLRACVGHVRALLRMPDVDQAEVMAWHAIDAAQSKRDTFDAQVAAAEAILREDEVVAMGSIPSLRVENVAARFGYIFLQEGEVDIAESLFQRAIQASKGTIKAHLGLAKIELMRGDYRAAMERSLRSLYMGNFTAKTLPAWAIFIEARRCLGFWRIRDGLIEKMYQSTPHSLSDRTILTIVHELRRNDMRQWQEVIESWTDQERGSERVRREFQKMRLGSEKKLTGNLSTRRSMASQIMQRDCIGFKDWLAAAREHAKTSYRLNSKFRIDGTVSQARQRFGIDCERKVRHSLARACEEIGRLSTARSLLLQNTDSHLGSKLWAKSVWALGRVEFALGNYAAAAAAYQLFVQHNCTESFNVQANLLRMQALIQAGDTESLSMVKNEMETAAGWISDPELLLNAARQLQGGPPDMQELRMQLILQGETALLAKIEEAPHPSVAIKMLFKLARRQVIDFNRSAQAISLWESFTDEKRDWLWSTSALFWEYMGMIFEAYVRDNQWTEAEQFAGELIEDPATPAEHLPFVGIPLARQLIRRQRVSDGLELARLIVLKAPRHSLSSWAWYWLALDAYQQEDFEKACQYANLLREAQGAKPGLLEGLDMRALYILADMDPGSMDTDSPTYNAQNLASMIQKVERDLAYFQ